MWIIYDKRTRSLGVAAVLSFFIPGLGHIYKGELFAGFRLIVSATMTFAVCYFACVPILWIGYAIVWVFAIYDAYTGAFSLYKTNDYN